MHKDRADLDVLEMIRDGSLGNGRDRLPPVQNGQDVARGK